MQHHRKQNRKKKKKTKKKKIGKKKQITPKQWNCTKNNKTTFMRIPGIFSTVTCNNAFTVWWAHNFIFISCPRFRIIFIFTIWAGQANLRVSWQITKKTNPAFCAVVRPHVTFLFLLYVWNAYSWGLCWVYQFILCIHGAYGYLWTVQIYIIWCHTVQSYTTRLTQNEQVIRKFQIYYL